MNEIACYVHVPFCAAKCPYCDFYSLSGNALRCDANQVAAYVHKCAEILGRENRYRWKSLYLGGGTPSVLPPALLGKILAAARERLLPGAEVTVECNPGSTTPALCEVLAAGGVNRVSLGLQSAVPRERAALGRTAGPEQILRALACLRSAGIRNISLDVMLGIPHQTLESLDETLGFCVAAGAGHVSAYLLKLEEGTPFGLRPPGHLPDEDAQAALYLHCCAWLEARGYRQYEISNFARQACESRHNLSYWRCEEYFALGPAAHGFSCLDRQREENPRRWHYPRDLDYFLSGGAPIDDGPGGDFEERAMLALRLSEGFRFPSAGMLEKARRFESQGLLVADGQGIRLTPEGFLVSNVVIGALLGG